MDSDADGSEDALESFVAGLKFSFRKENWQLILDRQRSAAAVVRRRPQARASCSVIRESYKPLDLHAVTSPLGRSCRR